MEFRRVLFRLAERHRNNSRLMQQTPERISGSREMMPNLFRAQTRIDTDEQNSRPAGQNIAQWHRRNCTTLAREASPTRFLARNILQFLPHCSSRSITAATHPQSSLRLLLDLS